MKIVSLIFLFIWLFISANAQIPSVGIIDFYGLQTISELQIRAALGFKEGDNLTDSKAEIEKRLAALPNVKQAKLAAVCCDAGKAIIYIGIQEKGALALQFRSVPKGQIFLPDEIVKIANGFYESLDQAVSAGDMDEDHSQGHSLLKNAKARAFQEKFIPFADQNLNLLRKVLYESSNAEHRAFAAQIIAYYKDKSAIIKDLVYGMKDADSNVRNNSMRALWVIADFAQNNPGKNINVPIEPFIDMLNSLEWTDRNKSSLTLMHLTEKRDERILSIIRRKALNSLIEMAQWKVEGHAYAPFIILARVVGISDDESNQIWQSKNRGDLIEKAKKLLPEKS